MAEVLEAARTSRASLPVIDMSGLWSSRLADRRAVGVRLNETCRDKGFFYIANHGVPEGLIDAVFAEAKRFFDQPPEVKSRVDKALSSFYRGYDPYRGQVLEVGTPPDLKEGFYHGPNQWPDDLPGFRPTMSAYMAAMLELGARLMRGLALSLDLPEDYFIDFTRQPMVTLRLLHYPPQPADAAPGEKGAGAHTDWDALTILLQDNVGGLQVHDRQLGWIHADPVPGAYVVNLGDMLARWTNDLYRSTLHRVVNLSRRERYSVPFFLGGNPDQIVEALPGCVGPDNPPRYAPTTAEGHLREMFKRSYGG